DKVRDAVNAHLQAAGARIAILKAGVVADGFDARFSATGRHYLYRILNRRAPAALEKGKVWWVPKRLDAEAMHEAAKVLLGKHDFTTFRSTQCQAESPVRTLDRLDVDRNGDFIEVRTSARSFLRPRSRRRYGARSRPSSAPGCAG
ncbi:tRNA pseudouridine(38-40) synthase TruA, partial [Mesorhizobium sp. M2D.F.Ca.ET.223.01.1.1]